MERKDITMAQVWANFYSYMAENDLKTSEKIHEFLAEERETQSNHIKRAEDHLKGVKLFYEQSIYEDPRKTEVKENINDETSIINFKHRREISNQKV
jgi:hypothetical protein